MLSDDGMAFGCGCQRSPCRDHHMGEATVQTFGYKKVREKKCTAAVHTLHAPKPVITFVFKVLRSALLRYILYTRPNL